MRCGGVNLRCSRLYHRRPVHLCRRPIHNGRLWLPWATITYPVKLLGQQPSKVNGKKIAVFPASIMSSNNLPSKLNSQSFKNFRYTAVVYAGCGAWNQLYLSSPNVNISKAYQIEARRCDCSQYLKQAARNSSASGCRSKHFNRRQRRVAETDLSSQPESETDATTDS